VVVAAATTPAHSSVSSSDSATRRVVVSGIRKAGFMVAERNGIGAGNETMLAVSCRCGDVGGVFDFGLDSLLDSIRFTFRNCGCLEMGRERRAGRLVCSLGVLVGVFVAAAAAAAAVALLRNHG